MRPCLFVERWWRAPAKSLGRCDPPPARQISGSLRRAAAGGHWGPVGRRGCARATASSCGVLSVLFGIGANSCSNIRPVKLAAVGLVAVWLAETGFQLKSPAEISMQIWTGDAAGSELLISEPKTGARRRDLTEISPAHPVSSSRDQQQRSAASNGQRPPS